MRSCFPRKFRGHETWLRRMWGYYHPRAYLLPEECKKNNPRDLSGISLKHNPPCQFEGVEDYMKHNPYGILPKHAASQLTPTDGEYALLKSQVLAARAVADLTHPIISH